MGVFHIDGRKLKKPISLGGTGLSEQVKLLKDNLSNRSHRKIDSLSPNEKEDNQNILALSEH